MRPTITCFKFKVKSSEAVLIRIPIIILGFLMFLTLTSNKFPYKPKAAITKVVIDAGHGGKDPGCIGKKTKEKDIALSIALQLGHYIEKNYPDVRVIYTRRDDNFVELMQRAEIANKNKADLFISIHCNANPSSNPYGVETYVMGINKSEANLAVAKKENSSILLEDDYKKKYDGFDPNSPEAYIIFSLYQNAFQEQSLNLASKIEKQFENVGRFNRGVKQAGFLVLYKTTMPGMLVETGFLSNQNEEEFLMSDAGQDKIAHSIFKAFREYKNEREGLKEETIAKKDKTAEKKSPADSLKKENIRQKEQIADTAVKKPKEKPVVAENKKSKPDSNSNALQNKQLASVNKQQTLYMKHKTADTAKSILLPEKNKVLRQVNKVDDIKQLSAQTVVFKVQFMTSSAKKNTKSAEFKGLDNVGNYSENGIFKYTVGSESDLGEAKKILNKVKDKGFKDAFIIAFSDGVRLKNINEALKIQSTAKEKH